MSYITIVISLLALFFAVLFNWVKATEHERIEVTSFTLKSFLLLIGVGITAYSYYQVYDFSISVEPLSRKDIVDLVMSFFNGSAGLLLTAMGVGYWLGASQAKKALAKESNKTPPKRG